jgi:hypothetical protein
VIIEWLLDFFEAGITWVGGGLPDSPVDTFDLLAVAARNLGALNYFLPIAELFTLVVAIVAVFPLLMGVSLSLWVVAQIRGSASSG